MGTINIDQDASPMHRILGIKLQMPKKKPVTEIQKETKHRVFLNTWIHIFFSLPIGIQENTHPEYDEGIWSWVQSYPQKVSHGL